MSDPVLKVEGLGVAFGSFEAVRNLSFEVHPHETLALVGESGSGKSATALSILRLIEREGGRIAGGRIGLSGKTGPLDLAAIPEDALTAIRGNSVSMVFQEPMTSLNPVLKIGEQVAEVFVRHRSMSRKEALAATVEALEQVRIPEPRRRLDQYPHELSGGLRQRVMIAMALACRPKLLIADEPTTALDVTTEAQILDLLKSLQEEFGMAIVFITHNFGVVADIADRVAVMYLGRIVETGTVEDIFYAPKHPYTRALLQSIPRLGQKKVRRLKTIRGSVPDPYNIPAGCPFHTRCDFAKSDPCAGALPPQRSFENGQSALCHFAGELPEASE